MQTLIETRGFRIALGVLGGTSLVLLGFTAGMNVGERKADNFEEWNANYQRMMAGPGFPGGMMPPFGSRLPSAHGAFGSVISAAWPNVVVQDRDGTEWIIIATTSTEVRIGRRKGSGSDVVPGDEAAVFGAPNPSGQIEARLIRILGEPKAR